MCLKKGRIAVFLLLVATAAYPQTPVIDSLQRLAAMHSRDTNEIKVLDELSTEFMRQDMDKARSYIYQQIALARHLQTDFKIAAAYSGLVFIHQSMGNLDSARHYLALLGSLVKKKPSDKGIQTAYAHTAGLFYKNQGEPRQALPYMLEGLRLLGPDGDKTNRAGMLLNVGNTYKNLSDFKNAVDCHLKALMLFEEVGNKRGQSFCLQNLGSDFFAMEQYGDSEKYLLRAEKLKEELNDKRGALTSWMTLGSVYQQTRRYDLAGAYFKKARQRARELKLTLDEARSLFNMGSLLKETKKNDAADQVLTEALPLAIQCGDSALVSRIRSYLVDLRNDVRKQKEEELMLVANVNIALEKGALDHTVEGHFALSKWYASRNEFEKAFGHLTKGQQLKDSIIGSEVVVQLKKLEEEYKNEKKERELVLLRKDQELKTLALSRQKFITTTIVIAFVALLAIGFLLINRYRVMNKAKRLIEIERVRNSIARDLHDDIGSALSSINILTKVALSENNGNAQNYFKRIGDQSARMMEDMGDMVWSINPRNDSMAQVVIRMREFAAEILESTNVEYRFSDTIAEGLTLSADKRKNLFLIFKESLNNAAKYSNARRIEISLHQRAQMLSLCVKDDGQGFDEHAVKCGNGLRNLHERAKAVSGTIAMKTAVGQGTEVELLFPLA
ncbi:MAG TPA: tetratricopeptide repeat protein [Ohtaekwangia sp.]|nr:tetratricopeptide repeat protein [Ohtaekwangia sp.]